MGIQHIKVNSLLPSDAIWRHRANFLMTPSHYLNHFWLIFSTSVRSCGIHLRALSSRYLKIQINKMTLNIVFLTLQWVNTLRLRQNGHYFADDIFKCIFLNKNIWISLYSSQKFVPKVWVNNIPALVQIMVWRRPGGKSLSEAMIT